MAGRKRTRHTRAAEDGEPLPVAPVDLLAGLAPGVVLETDPLPAGVAGAEDDGTAAATVDEIGRMLRSGDSTVRRLVRGKVIRQVGAAKDGSPVRAGVPPRTPERPGE